MFDSKGLQRIFDLIWTKTRKKKKRYTTIGIFLQFWTSLMIFDAMLSFPHIYFLLFSTFSFHLQFTYRSILVCGSSISCFFEYFFPQKKKHHVPLEKGPFQKRWKHSSFQPSILSFEGLGDIVFRGGPSGTPWPRRRPTPSCWDRGSFLMYIELGGPSEFNRWGFGGEIFWGWTKKMPGGDGFLRCLICLDDFQLWDRSIFVSSP